MALANIAATTDPEMFMIGGGVARAGEVLFNPLVRHYKDCLLYTSFLHAS